MMTTYRLKFLLLIIAYLLFCSSTYCIETPETTVAVTKTTSSVKSTPTNERLANKFVLTEWEKYKNFENKYHRNSDDEDDDGDKYKYNKEKSKKDHDDDDNDDDDNDDDDNRRSGSSNKDDDHSKPSNTVVTTIIVVSTEVPTSIYTGSTNPAKQKGTDDQINDPNSNTPKDQIPSETEIVDELIKGRNAYRQLVLALSIVGGIAGIALLTGTFIFVRMRNRKRKRRDLEMAQSSSSPPSSPSLTFPSPTHQPCSRPSSLNADSSRAMSEDGDMTVLNYDSDPFMDPPTTPTNLKLNQMFMNRSSMLPSAPPTTPTHLEPNSYVSYRQNQTLSMLSQTTSTAFPSAPSAKELNAIPKHENPFEDEYGSNHLDQQPSINRGTIRIRDHHTPIPSQNIPPSQRISLTQSTDSFSSDLPPPAYTPCAPSAPPLYALPTNLRSIEPLQHEEDSSRRHSISSCSVISSIRPLSLRRGSGSLAHISSSFS